MVSKRTKCWVGLGTLLFLLVGSSAFTQEKNKGADEGVGDPQPKARSLVRAGYTRPGSPADKIGDKGEIIQVAQVEEIPGPIIGSTVYFAVFRLNGAEGEGLPSE